MKSYLPLLLLALFVVNCTSVYKSGQTPDDVYFSPARPEQPADEYARVNKRDNRMYNSDDATLEDRYLRMKVQNRRYAFLDDDYDCYCYGSNYNRYYDYNRMNGFYGGSYNNSWAWNSGYGSYYHPSYYNPLYYNPYYGNPYYAGVVYGNISPVYNKPHRGNMNVYNGNNDNYNSYSPKGNSRVYSNSQSNGDNYRNSGTNAGGFLRNTFGSGNNSNNSSSNPAPSSSSSNSSSSSSSSSGHAPVRKF